MADLAQRYWKGLLIVLVFALIVVLPVSSELAVYFNSSVTGENITFSGFENQTRYISFPTGANVTFAFLNLTGRAGLFSLGNTTVPAAYNCTGSIASCVDGADGDFSTFVSVTSNQNGVVYSNYTIPDQTGYANITTKTSSVTSPNSIDCFNGTGWETIGTYTDGTDVLDAFQTPPICLLSPTLQIRNKIAFNSFSQGTNRFYEMNVSFFGNFTHNVTFDVGTFDATKEFNYSGRFNVSSRTNNLANTLNGILNSTCTGGTLNETNCTIPFLFHSDTAGVIGVDSIEINIVSNQTPNISINSPTGIGSSTTFDVNVTSLFSAGFDCSYGFFNITFGSGIHKENAPLDNCSFKAGASVDGGSAIYGIWVWVNDTSGRSSMRNQSFTIDTGSSGGSPPAAPGGGGGGGNSGPIIITGTNVSWTVETENGQDTYKLEMSPGSSRTRGIDFVNTGNSQVEITLSCEGSLCEFVEFETTKTTLPSSLVKRVTNIDMTITLPENSIDATHVFKVIAIDQEGNKAQLPVTVRVGAVGFITEFVQKVFTFKAFFIGAIVAALSFGALDKLILNDIRFSGLISLIVSMVVFVGTVMLV